MIWYTLNEIAGTKTGSILLTVLRGAETVGYVAQDETGSIYCCNLAEGSGVVNVTNSPGRINVNRFWQTIHGSLAPNVGLDGAILPFLQWTGSPTVTA